MERQEYGALLEKAYGELPEILKEHSRFVTPEIASRIQGKTTVVQNLGEVSKIINRNAGMLAKYLIREFGTSGSHDAQHLVMKGQFRQPQVQEKFEEFLGTFVLCPECGRPDTKILREERISFLKCEACGSRHPLSVLKTSAPKETKKPSVGEELTVEITRTGKKGDGMARVGEYIIFVSGAREGQKVKARITNVQGTMIFAEAVEVVK